MLARHPSRTSDAGPQAFAKRLASDNAGRSPLGAPLRDLRLPGRHGMKATCLHRLRILASARSGGGPLSRSLPGAWLRATRAGHRIPFRLWLVSGDALDERDATSSRSSAKTQKEFGCCEQNQQAVTRDAVDSGVSRRRTSSRLVVTVGPALLDDASRCRWRGWRRRRRRDQQREPHVPAFRTGLRRELLVALQIQIALVVFANLE
jgi:hypothetical protein